MEAQSVRAFGEALDDALAVAIFVVLLPCVGVGLPLRQHEVDQSCQLVCRGRDGLGALHARAQPAVIRAQR